MSARDGRRQVLSAAVMLNAAAGTLFAWSVLLRPLSDEFAVPADELGVVFSTALVVFALAVLSSGQAVDRYGPRRVAFAAAGLSGGGLALAAVAQNVLALHLGFGVLFGFGSGLGYLSAVAVATTRVDGRRSGAIGLVVAAYAAGPVVAAPVGTLGGEALGWRPTLALAAAAILAAMLLAARGLPGPPPSPSSGEPTGPDTVGDPLALGALWLLFFGSVAPGLFAFAYAAPAASERGVSVETAGFVVALMAVANLGGRLLAAPLCDRVGLHAALWLCVGPQALALGALGWVSSVVVTVTALPLLTLQYGLVSALLPAATRAVSGRARFGTAYGRVFSSFGAAAMAGPALGAVLHDGVDGYARGFRVSLLAVAVAAAALTAYRRRVVIADAAGSSR